MKSDTLLIGAFLACIGAVCVYFLVLLVSRAWHRGKDERIQRLLNSFKTEGDDEHVTKSREP